MSIFDGDGFVMRVDVAWPDRGVAIEADSRQYHLDPEAFEADRRKRNRAKAAGWSVLEVTHQMLRDRPEEVARVVADQLAARPAGSFIPLLGRAGALRSPQTSPER